MLGFVHATTSCSTQEEALALIQRASENPDALDRWVREGGDLNALLDEAS